MPAGRAALLATLIWLTAPALASAQSGPVTLVAQTNPPPNAAKSTTRPTTTGQAVAPASVKTKKPGETMALDDNQRSLVDRISLYLSTINTLVGQFVQVG